MPGRLTSLTYVADVRMPTEKAHGLQIARMCEAFQERGVQTTLVHPARRQPAALEGVDPLEFYSVRCRFEIRTLPNLDIVRVEPWLPGGVFTAAHFVHGRLWGAYAARRAMISAPADLFMARQIAVADSLVRRGAPTVLEVHDVPERWSLPILKRVASSPSLLTLVTLTHALRDTLTDRGVDTSRTLVLHDGVDLRRFEDASALARTDARPVVLYTGHLFPEKGIGVLVDAARLLGPAVAVKIVGGMPARIADWRDRVAREGPANVEFMGYLRSDQMPSLQKSADVLVLPNSGRHTHSSRYSSPMKLFEYMASGRPIVASDVPAIREVLAQDVNARLVPPDDATQLADAIRAILADPGLGRRLARQASEDVRRYAWSERASALAEAAGFSLDPSAAAVSSLC